MLEVMNLSGPPDYLFKPTTLDFEDYGRGWIVEEISKEYKTWKPVIQALKFEDGVWAVRFGYYQKIKGNWNWAKTGGMFLRADIIDELKEEIGKSVVIKSLLERFLE